MSRRVGLKHEQFNTNTQTRTDTCPAHVGWDELSRAHPDVGTFVTLLIIVFTANLATTNNTRENNQRLTRPCYLLSPPTLCPINEAGGLIKAMATLCSVTIPRSRLVHCDHVTMWHLGSWLRELEEKCVWQRPESESSWVLGDVPRYLILTVTAIRILVARELLMSEYRLQSHQNSDRPNMLRLLRGKLVNTNGITSLKGMSGLEHSENARNIDLIFRCGRY